MELTKAEEQIMQILWEIERGFVKDIVNKFGEPKPAYNTVSTIVRILEKKKFVSYESFGKTHQYFPIVHKDDYKKNNLKKMIDGYFNKSYQNLVSFFSNDKNLSIEDMEEIKKMMDMRIKNLKNKQDD